MTEGERIAVAAERIAGALEELLELLRPHTGTLTAYQRGGLLGARVAARQARKEEARSNGG